MLFSFTNTYINSKPAGSLSINKTEVDATGRHIDFESKSVTIRDPLHCAQVWRWFASPTSGAVRTPLFHQQVREKQGQRHDVKKKLSCLVLSFYVTTRYVYFCLEW